MGLFSGITDSLFGGGSSGSSKAANKSAQAAQDAVDFSKERYADWKELFGPLESSITEYYQSLSPEYYASQGIEDINQFALDNKVKIENNLIRRGLDDDSLKTYFDNQIDMDSAKQRASVRLDSERNMVNDQARWMQIGYGQNPSGEVLSSYQSQSGQQAQQAQFLAGQEKQQSASLGRMVGSAASFLSSGGLSSLFG